MRTKKSALLPSSCARKLTRASVAQLGGAGHRITVDLAVEGDIELASAVRHRPVDGERVAVDASSQREFAVFAREPAGQTRTLLLDVHREFLRALRRVERNGPFAAHVGLREGGSHEERHGGQSQGKSSPHAPIIARGQRGATANLKVRTTFRFVVPTFRSAFRILRKLTSIAATGGTRRQRSATPEPARKSDRR